MVRDESGLVSSLVALIAWLEFTKNDTAHVQYKAVVAVDADMTR